jgi:hypothetical protein
MILLSTADFVDFYFTPINPDPEGSESKLQAYIDRYERFYLRRLLGVALSDDFITDLANASQDVIYSVIQDPFAFDDPNQKHVQRISMGMVDMLTAFIYYHYVTDEQARNTFGGVAYNNNEANNMADMQNAYRHAEKKYNEALDTYNAIQWYVDEYQPTDYPDYNGVPLNVRFLPIF